VFALLLLALYPYSFVNTVGTGAVALLFWSSNFRSCFTTGDIGLSTQAAWKLELSIANYIWSDLSSGHCNIEL
jgi:hypothetical protein